jgi:hypothetical protein
VKVVLLSARMQRPDDLEPVRSGLGLTEGDGSDLALVQWRRPRVVLPVDRVLVLGPERGLDAWPAFRPVGGRGDTPATVEEPTGEDAEVVAVSTAPAPARPTGLRRVRRAVGWRVNRARIAVRRSPLRARVLQSTKVRRAKEALLPGSTASRFAVAALRSRPLRLAVSEADLVIALDTNTHRAAWLLARRHPGPDVVVGLEAARAALLLREARASA